MTSVMTEIQTSHEPPHPWSAAMRDTRMPQNGSDSSRDMHRSSSSASRPLSNIPRSRHGSSASQNTSAPTPSTSGSSQPATSSSESRTAQVPEEPNSPQLLPAELSSEASRPPAPATPDFVPSSSNTPIPDALNSPIRRSASPQRIIVRDLEHIQSFAGTETSSDEGSDDGTPPQYVISDMSIDHVIEMIAGLLTKITTTNDEQHDVLHRSVPAPDVTNQLSQQTNSVLAFHGKNVPSITILQYLGRVQKYCPATYEVFLSLLVYFDRMTERVNSGQMISLRQADQASRQRAQSRRDSVESYAHGEPQLTPPSSDSTSPRIGRQEQSVATSGRHGIPSPPLSDSDPTNLSSLFVVDSFNIHRLVIAGVTCAAKFFSDVFFTNSRYAKVGGLPLAELNHLELQFLHLNDFRLSVSVEELDSYATMLVEFYAREIAAQREDDRMEGVEIPAR